MKKTFAVRTATVLAATVLAVSCGNAQRQQVVAESRRQRDSLTTVIGAKDSLINAVFADINAISENLALIKSRENLITVASGAENGRQLAEKKTEVEQLRDELTRMGSEVETLAETVAERTAEVEDLSGEKLELENRLHTVYYIVGAEKELRDAQIVNKQGFIGRTLTVGQHGSMESFTQADSRLLSEIPVGHRKVTVVSTHPEGSYELVTDGSKSVEKLLITDPVRFWESSKVLVVSYK